MNSIVEVLLIIVIVNVFIEALTYRLVAKMILSIRILTNKINCENDFDHYNFDKEPIWILKKKKDKYSSKTMKAWESIESIIIV